MASAPKSQRMPDAVIAGALFDFIGYLTTRDTPIVCSSTHEPHAVLDALEGWAATRALDLDASDVMGWSGARHEPNAAKGDVPGTDPRPWPEQVHQFITWIAGSRCIETGGESGNRGCMQNCQGCAAHRLLARGGYTTTRSHQRDESKP